MTQFQGSKKLRSIFTKERKVEYQTPGCEFGTVQIADPYPRKESKMGLSHMVAELKKKTCHMMLFLWNIWLAIRKPCLSKTKNMKWRVKRCRRAEHTSQKLTRHKLNGFFWFWQQVVGMIYSPNWRFIPVIYFLVRGLSASYHFLSQPEKFINKLNMKKNITTTTCASQRWQFLDLVLEPPTQWSLFTQGNVNWGLVENIAWIPQSINVATLACLLGSTIESKKHQKSPMIVPKQVVKKPPLSCFQVSVFSPFLTTLTVTLLLLFCTCFFPVIFGPLVFLPKFMCQQSKFLESEVQSGNPKPGQ